MLADSLTRVGLIETGEFKAKLICTKRTIATCVTEVGGVYHLITQGTPLMVITKKQYLAVSIVRFMSYL